MCYAFNFDYTICLLEPPCWLNTRNNGSMFGHVTRQLKYNITVKKKGNKERGKKKLQALIPRGSLDQQQFFSTVLSIWEGTQLDASNQCVLSDFMSDHVRFWNKGHTCSLKKHWYVSQIILFHSPPLHVLTEKKCGHFSLEYETDFKWVLVHFYLFQLVLFTL